MRIEIIHREMEVPVIKGHDNFECLENLRTTEPGQHYRLREKTVHHSVST